MRMVLLWVVYHDIMVGLFGHVQGERRFVYTTRPKQGSKAMQNAAVKESIDVSDSLLNLSNATEVEVRKVLLPVVDKDADLEQTLKSLVKRKAPQLIFTVLNVLRKEQHSRLDRHDYSVGISSCSRFFWWQHAR